jgi:hypothetical protein
MVETFKATDRKERLYEEMADSGKRIFSADIIPDLHIVSTGPRSPTSRAKQAFRIRAPAGPSSQFDINDLQN